MPRNLKKPKPKKVNPDSHMAHRYTVGYSHAENELVESICAAKGLATGTWIRMVSLEAARAELGRSSDPTAKGGR